MIKVAELYVKTQKGLPPDKVNKLLLVNNSGVFGDVFALGGDRQVCLLFKETKQQLEAMENKPACISKFSCNILLDGGKASDIAMGGLFTIGTARLEISKIGRECHNLCNLKNCPLIDGVIFAKVINGGEIAVGDEAEYA